MKYYEYIEESGEIITNCIMCGQSTCLDEHPPIKTTDSIDGLDFIEELDNEQSES